MREDELMTSLFENILQNDALFVEYFNSFLDAPAFSRKLKYDQSSKILCELKEQNWTCPESPTVNSICRNNSKSSKSKDGKILMDWCKTNRLPFFIKSRHYCEYKLIKHLLSDRDYRTYSAVKINSFELSKHNNSPILSLPRTSNESYARSFSQSSVNSWPQISNEFARMPSRATSMPNLTLNQKRIKSSHAVGKQQLGINRPATTGNTRLSNDAGCLFDEIEADFKEQCNEEIEGEENVFDFDNNEEFDKQTEFDVRSLSLKYKLTLQELKAASIRSIQDVEKFKSFLADTNGFQLLKFWLDAEIYKQQIRDWRDLPDQRKQLGIRIFRLMQDRYKHCLTQDAKEQIIQAVLSDGYSEGIFLRAQFDVLRRLKYYWLPRFLVHVERQSELEDGYDLGITRMSSAMSFFPSLSVVKTLPTLGHVLSEEARENSFTSLYKFRENSRVKSGYLKKVKFILPNEGSDNDAFLDALQAETDTGLPFTAALKRMEKLDLLNCLQFWLDVDEILKQNDKQEDRLYRLCNAWNIFNRYLSEVNMIINDKKLIDRIRTQLTNTRDLTKETAINLFGDLQKETAELLREAWEDVQIEENTKVNSFSRDPSATSLQSSPADAVNQGVQFSPTRWVKRYPGSSGSERRQRLQTALSLAEECNMSRQSSREVQQIEKPKRKKRRKKQGVKFRSDDTQSENEDPPKEEEKTKFSDLIDNKEVLTAFKQFIQNEEGRDTLNNLSLYLEIENFNEIHQSKRLQRQQQSTLIYRTYFDTTSRRAVTLPDEVIDKVEDENPTTPVLHEAQELIMPDLDACFQKFYKKVQHVAFKTREVTTSETLRTTANGNKPDTMESFRSYHSHVNTPKVGKKKRKGTGRLPPSKEDRTTFLDAVHSCAGKMTTEMDVFRKYLLQKDDPGPISRLEKNLLFYLEVQKFKDLYPFMDETSLNRKVEVIIDVFLDSATPPWLQIDLNSEQAAKVMQRAQQYYSMTKRVPREQKDPYIFDDVHLLIQKELLPYWAGFCKKFRSEEKLPEFPVTKKEREQKKRYKDFLKAANSNEKVLNRPKTPGLGESKHELTFTVAKGFKWKEATIDLESISSGSTASKTSGSRKSSIYSVT